MKKIFIPLLTFILSFLGWSKAKTQEIDNSINDCHSNLYLDSASSSEVMRRQHYSHTSAHHYSAITYVKSVRSNLIKDISKSEKELQKINEVLSLGHMPSDGRKARCSVSQISYVELFSINELEINKRCYMINFISEYVSRDSHSHTYRSYYITEDGTTYYKTQPFMGSGEIKELEWGKQILELIK
jgi:hypothetical protein